jgi:PAT family beta-lactamase induction signal transducer AmpG
MAERTLEQAKKLSPWLFIPTLYFAQGLPGTMVQQMTGILLKDLGIDNKNLAAFTALISWPWVLKMFWGAMVDTRATKRSWIVGTQIAVGGLIALAAFSMLMPFWLAGLLVAFFVLAFVSATHDIAADGFYLMSVEERDQSFFIGIRSTFYRLSAIFTTTGLVFLAGMLKDQGVGGSQRWCYAIAAGAIVYTLVLLWNVRYLPRPPSDAAHAPIRFTEALCRFGQVVTMLAGIILAWRLLYMAVSPIGYSLTGKAIEDAVAAWGTPLFQETTTRYENMGFAAQLMISLVIIAAGALCLWRLWTSTGMAHPVRVFFAQDKIVWVLGFILFFRFGEVMIGTLSAPFLQDPVSKGGLGVELKLVGTINGVVGIGALTLGGILGGIFIAKWGIKRCLWPMVLALNIPNLLYVWAASTHPDLGGVYALVAVDQFGYGFGFSAYMVYLLFICRGKPMETSIYAIATGLMLLGANVSRMVTGAVWGWVQSSVPPERQYQAFFLAVLGFTVPGMLTLPFIPLQGQDIHTGPSDLD